MLLKFKRQIVQGVKFIWNNKNLISLIMRLVQKRFFNQTLTCIREAATPEEAQWIYHTAPSGSYVERRAFLKWIALCSNVEELKMICNSTGDSESEMLVVEKIQELIYRLG